MCDTLLYNLTIYHMANKMRFYHSSSRKTAKPYYIYDASIEDLEERKSKRLYFPEQQLACNFLGIRKFGGCLDPYTNTQAIKKGKRFFSKKHNKEFIIRLAVT